MTKKHRSGATLIELMIVIGICTLMLSGIFTTFMTGQATWFTADSSMEIRNDVRVGAEKIARELRESGSNSAGVLQVTLLDGAGANTSDILRFSIPIQCNSATALLDNNGNVANWGAPLTWGCTSSSCMDANNSCAALEYKYVQYEITASNTLVRKVLGPALGVVAQETIARNMTNMQLTQSADQNVVTIVFTAQITSPMRKQVTITKSLNVYLRNRG